MEKIRKIRESIKKNNLDGYLIPKNDEFFGEYIPQNKDNLKFISNFSGSYGFALILKKKNYLFVDGRYTQQAKDQSGKFFNIINISDQFPSNILKSKRLKIGFDPRLHTKRIMKIFFGKTNCRLVSVNQNLVKKIWLKKKNIDFKKFYTLNKKAISQNYRLKIITLVKKLKKKKN